MSRLIIIIACTSIVLSSGFAQGTTLREIEKIANKFESKVLDLPSGEYNVLVSDFTDGEVVPTELGRFLAEEFSFHLTEINKEGLSILDRSKIQRLYEEEKMSELLIDPLSTIRLGGIKGMSHMVYGTIVESGEQYTIYLKLIAIETQETLITTRGSITKLPSLPSHN